MAVPATLPHPLCASSCLEEASPFHLCRGSREDILILEWASMRRPERATMSMVLHIHVYAPGCCSLSPRWALHLYTSLSPMDLFSFQASEKCRCSVTKNGTGLCP